MRHHCTKGRLLAACRKVKVLNGKTAVPAGELVSKEATTLLFSLRTDSFLQKGFFSVALMGYQPARAVLPKKLFKPHSACSDGQDIHTALRFSKNAPMPSSDSPLSQHRANAATDMSTASRVTVPPSCWAKALASATAPGAQDR